MPEEANLRFLQYHRESLVRPGSSVKIVALQDKSRKYKSTMEKMKRKIQELSQALEQNTKSVELEKTHAVEAQELQMKAEYKVESLQRVLKLLKQEQELHKNN